MQIFDREYFRGFQLGRYKVIFGLMVLCHHQDGIGQINRSFGILILEVNKSMESAHIIDWFIMPHRMHIKSLIVVMMPDRISSVNIKVCVEFFSNREK